MTTICPQAHPNLAKSVFFSDPAPRWIEPASKSNKTISKVASSNTSITSSCKQETPQDCCRGFPSEASTAGQQDPGGNSTSVSAAASELQCISITEGAAAVVDRDGSNNTLQKAANCSYEIPQHRTRKGVAGDRWRLPVDIDESECAMVWFGSAGGAALQVLQLAYSSCDWLCCEPVPGGRPKGESGDKGLPTTSLTCAEGLVAGTQALLKRRYFHVEKAKQANIVGILVRFHQAVM